MLSASGLVWQKRSGLEESGADAAARVLLVDRVGELAAWWGTAAIAYVGGSMGIAQRPEHDRAGRLWRGRVVWPQARGTFATSWRHCLAGEAAVVVHDGSELSGFVRRCLAEPAWANELGRRAQRVVASQLGATRHTADLVDAMLAGHHASNVRRLTAA